MKLRIQGNSLRLRVTKPEVEQLAASGNVGQTIDFGIVTNHKLRYSLVSSNETTEVRADFDENTIAIYVPHRLAQEWAKTERVGFSAEQNTADKETLSILVEKDFACLKKRAGNDDSDTYPNPKAANAAC